MFKKFNIKNLVPAADMVMKAKEGKYAIGQFNINNLEWTRAILETAQENNSPVILGVSEGAMKYFGGFDVIMGCVTGLIKNLKITIPVAVHLDHGQNFEICKNAVEAGLTSIMIDGSHLPLDENIKVTKEVISLCKKYGISVEGEIGQVGGEEDGVVGMLSYAEVDDCVKFAKETDVSFFAATLGSVHGHYNGEPKLAFDRMEEIREKTGLALVLHGGSGIPDNMIQKAIHCGEAKINVNTECQDEFAKATRKYFEDGKDKVGKGYDPRKILKPGIEAVKKVVKEKMTLFGSINKA